MKKIRRLAYMTGQDKKIEDLGIYELRTLARSVGVQSPTSKKREELIQAIHGILEGKENPYLKKDGRGRPAKSATALDQLSSVFVPSSLNYDLEKQGDKYTLLKDNEYPFAFHQNQAMYQTNATDTLISVQGIVDQNTMGVYILRVKFYDFSKEDIFIPQDIVQSYKITIGDMVEGKAEYLDQTHPLTLKEIATINGIAYEKYQVSNPASCLQKGMVFSSEDIQIEEGKRTLLLYHGKQNLQSVGQDISQNIEEKNVEIFYICLNTLDGESIYEGKHYHFVPVDFTKEATRYIIATKLAFKRASTLAKTGKKVIVVFHSLSAYIKAYSKVLDTQDQEKTVAIQTLKEYLSYAKQYENGGSMTIVCLENESLIDSLKKVIEYEFMDIFHHIETIQK